jgi:hypothetical protein
MSTQTQAEHDVGPARGVGPPKKGVGRTTPHHQGDRPSTNTFSSQYTADQHSLSDQPCRCRRCGRVLTSPLSVSVGAGPVCRRHPLGEELSAAVESFRDLVVA